MSQTSQPSRSAALAARDAALADFAAENPDAKVRSQAILAPKRLVGTYFPEGGTLDFPRFEAHHTINGTFRATRLG